MRDLYLSGVNYESIADGEGVRATFFFSGCKHNCKGCHSKDTHNFKYGTLVTEEVIDKIQKELDKRPFLSGITLSGGDPIYSSDLVLDFLSKLNLKNLDIWLYTGFTIEEIYASKEMASAQKLIEKCKIVVDGRFEIESRDVTSPFKGSLNQRIIDIEKSELPHLISLWRSNDDCKK